MIGTSLLLWGVLSPQNSKSADSTKQQMTILGWYKDRESRIKFRELPPANSVKELKSVRILTSHELVPKRIETLLMRCIPQAW